MKRRILKKFVKAYRPYGLSREGILLGMKEEGHSKYWCRGSHVRWWTHHRHQQRKFLRAHPDFEILIWIKTRQKYGEQL